MRDSTNVQAPVEKKAIIAMSGGVDSSVAALLCQQQGFDCVGVTLAAERFVQTKPQHIFLNGNGFQSHR